jgi:trehalose/maltose transport system substrate-binding protein
VTPGAVIDGEEQARRVEGRSTTMAGKFGYAGVPGGPGGRFSMLGGSGLAVPSRSSHRQEAVELIRFLVRDDRRLAPRPDAPAVEVHDVPLVLNAPSGPHRSAIAVRPSNITGGSYEAVTRAYVQSLHSVLTGEKSAAHAAAELERRLVEITGFEPGPPR